MDWAAKEKKKKHKQEVQAVKESLVSPEISLLIAKKAFTIVQNEHVYEIKVGDNLNHIPEQFLVNLKSEGVID